MVRDMVTCRSGLRASSRTVAAIFKRGGDESGPAGLVTGPQPAAGVPIEVLVEEDVVTPVRVIRVACERAVARPRPALLRNEQGAEPLRELVCHAIEVCELARSGRAFDPERIPVVAVVLSQSLDQEEVDGKPHRPTPIRVSTELRRVHI